MTRNSTRARRLCLETHGFEYQSAVYLQCHVCHGIMDVATRAWEADHIRRHAEGGEDTADNLWPICRRCHVEKSRRDTTEIAKGKRIGERNQGVRRSARPLPGTRASGWKRKLDGSVERR